MLPDQRYPLRAVLERPGWTKAVLLLLWPEDRLTIAQKKMLATIRQVDPGWQGENSSGG